MEGTIARIQVRANKDLKDQATELFHDMGMDLGTAINMFLAETVNEGRLPFRPAASRFDREMIDAEHSPVQLAGDVDAMKDIVRRA